MRIALFTRNQRDQKTLDDLEAWARDRYGDDIDVVRACQRTTRSPMPFDQMLDEIADGDFDAFVSNTVHDVAGHQGRISGMGAVALIENALRNGRLDEYCLDRYGSGPQRVSTVADVVAEHFMFAEPDEVVAAARQTHWLLRRCTSDNVLAAIDAVVRAADAAAADTR